MDQLIVFDLDGTLTLSKSPVDDKISGLLHQLLGLVQVAVISGGGWPQFENQLLPKLPRDERLGRLTILPTCGTQLYRCAEGKWTKVYSEDLQPDEKQKIISSLHQALETVNLPVENRWGETIEDRGTQITFSGLGQHAPLDEKIKWDPHFSKRKEIRSVLIGMLPGFNISIGGTTSIDITKPGIDKAFGIRKLHEILNIPLEGMLYVGDSLFPGGNDYPVKLSGVRTIPVKNILDTAGVIQRVISGIVSEREFDSAETESFDGIHLTRLGSVMKPQPGNLLEANGTLNPAAVRGPDGELYLFPRFVSNDNSSCIGIARVLFDSAGNPCCTERLGIALEPEAVYEFRADGAGGCEDARVTFVVPLNRYFMTYTAFSSLGPRIAVAVSDDLFHWKRLGLATFESFNGIDFVNVDNKDASIFPTAVPNHAGKMQMALIHRPLFPDTRPEETVRKTSWREVDVFHESIWISFCPMPPKDGNLEKLGVFNSHHRLATPVYPWERLKIGGGPPPVLTDQGWLLLYHGVGEIPDHGKGNALCYSAGMMVLSSEFPLRVLYRSKKSVLSPSLPEERKGVVPNVVFPTGIDRRYDINKPNRFDVYYGMADQSIGVARLDLPGEFLFDGESDPPDAKV
ncbi:MAG TPA: HAD-IIB family hydrolase [Paludibacter sp.]|nr:HAD-IIB family hydrolase [Paludibacter sp.]